MKWLVASLAGGLCGGLEAVLTYPAEYAKTLMQLRTTKGGGGMGAVLVDTARREGIRGCYRGVGVVVAGGIPKHGLRFGVHDAAKPTLGSFFGGMLGGVCASFGAVIPQETIKTTLIKNPHRFSSGFAVAQHIFRERGLLGFYTGCVPTASKNALNTAIRFPVQSFLRNLLPQHQGASADAFFHGLAGVVAGWVSVAATQPFDTVKTKQQGACPATATSLSQTIVATWRLNGVRAFYAGTVPRLLRVAPENAILFSVFPSVRHALSEVLDGVSE